MPLPRSQNIFSFAIPAEKKKVCSVIVFPSKKKQEFLSYFLRKENSCLPYEAVECPASFFFLWVCQSTLHSLEQKTDRRSWESVMITSFPQFRQRNDRVSFFPRFTRLECFQYRFSQRWEQNFVRRSLVSVTRTSSPQCLHLNCRIAGLFGSEIMGGPLKARPPWRLAYRQHSGEQYFCTDCLG